MLLYNGMSAARRRWPAINARLIAVTFVGGLSLCLLLEPSMFLTNLWGLPGSAQRTNALTIMAASAGPNTLRRQSCHHDRIGAVLSQRQRSDHRSARVFLTAEPEYRWRNGQVQRFQS
jgi:hypothetical protein